MQDDKTKKIILITGTTGFVGQHLLDNFLKSGDFQIRCLNRKAVRILGIESFAFDEIDDVNSAKEIFQGVDVVIHLAGLAHQKNAPMDSYKAANTDLTLKLANLSIEYGVRRFLFLSSIGVNGASSKAPFNEYSPVAPVEYYSISKLDAENGLKKMMVNASTDWVIVRPPLIYGPKAPGNFGRLIRLINRGLPIPFGAIDNKRSFIFIGNLVDLIIRSAQASGASRKVILASDNEVVSTSKLLRIMIREANSKSVLLSIPQRLLNFIFGFVNKSEEINKLSCDLEIDITSTKNALDWTPPYSLEDGIRRCFDEAQRK